MLRDDVAGDEATQMLPAVPAGEAGDVTGAPATEVAGDVTGAPATEVAGDVTGAPATEVAGATLAAAGTTSLAAAGTASLAADHVSEDILAAPLASLTKSALTLNVGNQAITLATDTGLATTWQTYLNANAPKEFATQIDAARYVKAQANTILTTAEARVGLSAFSGVLHTLNQHVPLAGRGIVVGGQAIGDLHIRDNVISGVLMGISVGVSHRASTAEADAKQRTPDHMQTIRIVGNTIACSANDVASKSARFGVFVGNANSLEIAGNRVTSTAAGISTTPPADAIRVVGYIGMKAVIRHNHATGFAMGIRVIPLTGNGPGKRAPSLSGVAYTDPIRSGSLWLVADNAIESASATAPIGPFTPTKGSPPAPAAYIDAAACVLVNNVNS
jgi:hypothetical protein